MINNTHEEDLRAIFRAKSLIADSQSKSQDIDGLSETLMDLANLTASLSEALILARGQKETTYMLNRLDKDVGHKIQVIRSRISALKHEQTNSGLTR